MGSRLKLAIGLVLVIGIFCHVSLDVWQPRILGQPFLHAAFHSLSSPQQWMPKMLFPSSNHDPTLKLNLPESNSSLLGNQSDMTTIPGTVTAGADDMAALAPVGLTDVVESHLPVVTLPNTRVRWQEEALSYAIAGVPARDQEVGLLRVREVSVPWDSPYVADVSIDVMQEPVCQSVSPIPLFTNTR